jgi:uncharacterized protein YcfJ
MKTTINNSLTDRHRLRALLLGSLLVLTGKSVLAADYYVMAPVVSVDPIVIQQEVERPVQHCSEVQESRHPHYYSDRRYDRRDRHEKRFVPSLIGGLVGGLIGNQFGGGSGKKILTVVGALAGSSIANDIAHEKRSRRAYAAPVRRSCYTTYQRETVEQIDGYHVVYEYAGQEFSKQLNEHPGDEVQVKVQLSPAREI